MADGTLVKTIEIHNVKVDGYDAEHWRDSYIILRDAIIDNLDEFVHDDDAAEEGILCTAVEQARRTLDGIRDLNGGAPLRDAAFVRKSREIIDRATDRAHAMLDEEHANAASHALHFTRRQVNGTGREV